jgi:hypothetical protein
MRLLEIKSVQQKGKFVPPGDHMGQGTQGKAYLHPSRPNSIIKTADVEDPETDSYVDFIKLSMKHQNNPFFPKIYNAKIVANKDNIQYPYTLIVNMEKLQPLRDSKVSDVAKEMLERLGFPHHVAQIPDRDHLFYYMNSSSNRAELANNTKNPQFKEALELLEPYIKYFHHDLHADNLMVRLTGSGPQIVIIDPLKPS